METLMVIEKVKTAQPTTGKRELVIEKIEVGEWVRQGDIYIMRLPDVLDVVFKGSRVFKGSSHVEIAPGHTPKAESEELLFGVSLSWAKNTSKTKEGKKFLQDLEVQHKSGVIFKSLSRWEIPHEEHAKLVMPPGTYLGWPQTEVDPLTGQERQVLD